MIFKDFGFSGSNFENIFGQMFGGSFGGANRYNSVSGNDLTCDLEVDFLESYFGAQKQIKIPRSNLNIKVTIPRGVATGAKLRIPGKGEQSPYPGGHPGDLYLRINVVEDSYYTRVGDDLEVRLTLGFSDLALGKRVEIETPQGTKNIRVPAGISPGTKLRLRGLGFFHLKTGRRGDLFVVMELSIPKKLSDKQKEAVTKLKDLGL